MDNEKIFAMKAGKELDNEVTTEIMEGVFKNYSKDISSAWKVMKKIEEKGWRIDILSSTNKETVGGVKEVLKTNFMHQQIDFLNLKRAL